MVGATVVGAGDPSSRVISFEFRLHADGRGRISDVSGGYRVLNGWRVGHSPDESVTRTGLLVPVGTKDGTDAMALIDVKTGQRFWAAPSGAWRFIWPPTGKPVVAVRDSQIIAEEDLGHVGDEGQYL